MLVLHIRDAPVAMDSTGTIKQEERGDDIVKEENNTDTKASDQVIRATAHPSIVLSRRFVQGSQIQGAVPPVHTYLVRQIEEGNAERRGAKRRSLSKENVPIVKRRK